ncbi:MAG: hypothetical protein PHN22_03590 [Candidatus ainarchaeum sp.]|nr:hypothetical protein [Candidatus ainarchaeum sp.]
MYSKRIIIDIETCPINLDGYFEKEEDEKLKLLNPIDSKIVAIGLRFQEKNYVFSEKLGSESKILELFWQKLKEIKTENKAIPIIGFNIISFDISFLTTRSLLNNVKIYPFSLSEILDLRDKIHAYKYGKTRGKLKEIALILGQEILDVDGSDVSFFCKNKQFDLLEKYLEKDLEITDFLYKKIVDLDIIKIKKY